MIEPYALELSDRAENALRRLDRTTAERIARSLRRIAEHATEVKHEALTGEWSGYYRVRVGKYRAIYRLEHHERLIVVEVIGHRRDVYDE